eukprot:6772487-Pyramimonas_sp.AAC.1
MPLRDSIEIARWPGARIRSVAALSAIMALAVSLSRTPYPSEYKDFDGSTIGNLAVVVGVEYGVTFSIRNLLACCQADTSVHNMKYGSFL